MSNRFENITDTLFVDVFMKSISIEDIKRKLNLPMNGTSGRFVSETINRLMLNKEILKQNYKNQYYIHKICPVCGKEFFVSRCGRDSKQITCSYACSNTFFRSGENNGMYGATKNGDNYRTICFLKHPHRCCICGEEKIVSVHHLDGNHYNNEVSNLIPLCPTHHQYLHSRYKNEIIKKVLDYQKQFVERFS